MSRIPIDLFDVGAQAAELIDERRSYFRRITKAPVRGMDLSSLSQEDTIALLMQKLEGKINGYEVLQEKDLCSI